ncbi:kinesin-like protein KIF17 isoform X2 [Rhopilema esculentum]|uniref:kinesin-like protein KIF17 isoform X2 n=1 Tax=Rhopilema esculentum TaxID=499914 RepID=UPI0031D9E4AA
MMDQAKSETKERSEESKAQDDTMSECVKVIVRCRPLNDVEVETNTDLVLSVDRIQRTCILRKPGDKISSPRKVFTFDGVYDAESTNEEIYADFVGPLVESVLEGYNGCVFAYGQTSCGKTFSMQGIQSVNMQRGIINRAIDQIFESIQVTDVTYYTIRASYLEIYNEEIRDLLNKGNRYKLDIKEHPEKGVYVRGLSSVEVTTVEEMEEVVEYGGWNRALGATALNPDSSRSHCIFVIDFELCFTSEGDNKEHFRSGRLNLVDLAGSERQRKAKQGEERLKEATKINLSLSALGNVISALVSEKCKHIPYRASKLTRLLQDSLGGNSRTLMIACLSPGENNYHETLSTLRYANRAKNIKNRPRINEDPKDALIRQYQKEIKMLRQMLMSQIKISDSHNLPMLPPLPTTASSDLEELSLVKPPFRSAVVISKQARLEYEQKISELQHRFDYEHINNERLQATLQSLKTEFDNYRLRSEYSLQRLQVENKARLEAMGGRNTTTDKSDNSSSSEEFPVSTTSGGSCSSCEEFFWSDKSFDRSIFHSETNSQENDSNSHLWSSSWLRCYCSSPKRFGKNKREGSQESIPSEISSRSTGDQSEGADDDKITTESEKVLLNRDEKICKNEKEFELGSREMGDGNSDTPTTPEEANGNVVTKEPRSIKEINANKNDSDKVEETTAWLLICASCFGENYGEREDKSSQTTAIEEWKNQGERLMVK